MPLLCAISICDAAVLHGTLVVPGPALDLVHHFRDALTLHPLWPIRIACYTYLILARPQWEECAPWQCLPSASPRLCRHEILRTEDLHSIVLHTFVVPDAILSYHHAALHLRLCPLRGSVCLWVYLHSKLITHLLGIRTSSLRCIMPAQR